MEEFIDEVFKPIDDEVVTFKKSDVEYMAKCFKHLQEEVDLLKLQLEPQDISETLNIDLSNFNEIIN